MITEKGSDKGGACEVIGDIKRKPLVGEKEEEAYWGGILTKHLTTILVGSWDGWGPDIGWRMELAGC